MDFHGTVVPKMKLSLKKGALHKQLGLAPDKKIPMAKLEQAKRSNNPITKKRAVFALNARKWNKKG